ncbi:elongation factor P [Candidatus Woesebacteria bacterium RIFCSPHIGHO2_01_FULL_39_32]|uniref:Elongation factor P n=2 Tax=Candidatus Woeseibacteriota TaxID=1752722 RepID=A0A0G0PSD4_9BACT|nr:MAG: Elongation factor P [Candidatus Woesebacteria bacterium GW2011_GWA1_39_8]OGM03632.1 MAG: elongation factor P [Candidatus Woesebacteria bacterium GWB1_37_5]OGM23899.1 MAG: elongation factor P [Candidatus Woesebacteria bacterium RIFCSPHIGHO2_01_FULL_39_32]OGM38637.1 MAG: elongation factor P [Candidatus Woesebacteria bacterium RIFCSPHIGHO2_12_FULL_38_11]OGM64088.1 MAG: elongation factor P [Candidatus Woesebacteria bacterium RIFCSPLOWO2_01_FULL_39_25]
MIQATDLKNGTTFLSNGKPYRVIKYTHTKMGRGGATVRVTAKDLVTGAIEDKTFSSNVKVDDVLTSKRKLQFLYKMQQNAVFMDPKTYEQVEIPLTIIKDELPYIKEGNDANVLFWSFGGAQGKEDRPLSIEIPPKATLLIADTSPGIKGNSATNMYKPATLENALSVKVPLFINKGDKIVVDTRTGEYVERAK